MNMEKKLPLGILLAFSGKALALGTSPSESAIIIGLISLLSVKEYLDKNKKIKEVEESVDTKLKSFEAIIKKQNEVITAQAEAHDKLQTAVTSVKMQYGVQNVMGRKTS